MSLYSATSVERAHQAQLHEITDAMAEQTSDAAFQMNERQQESVFAIQDLGYGLFASVSMREVKVWHMRGQTEGNIEHIFALKSKNFTALCALKNGHIASGTNDGYIQVWNTTTGKCVQQFKAHDEAVSGILELQHSDCLVSGSDKTIKIWGNAKHSCFSCCWRKCYSFVKEYSLAETIANRISTMLELFDGSVVCGSLDGRVTIWNIANGQCLHILDNAGGIRSLALLEDNVIACGLQNGNIKIWKPEEVRVGIGVNQKNEFLGYENIQTLTGHSSAVYSITRVLKWGTEGKLFASSSIDGVINIWLENERQWRLHKTVATSAQDSPSVVAIESDSRLVRVTRHGNEMTTWDPTLSQLVPVASEESRSMVTEGPNSVSCNGLLAVEEVAATRTIREEDLSLDK